MKSVFLQATPLTADKLSLVTTAGTPPRTRLCKGVDSSSPGYAACK